ncbi:hypothetical protein ACSLOS_24135, partial [Klebsiella pneumoniae]
IKPFQFPRFEEALTTWREKRKLITGQPYYEQADVDRLLFGLGVEKGCAALRQRQDIDAIFVTKNRDIILSSPQRLRFAPLDSGYRVIDCTA